MALSKNRLATSIIVVLALALLYALNPTMDDFAAWSAARARDSIAAGGSGEEAPLPSIASGAGEAAGAPIGIAADRSPRSDYLLCSTYSSGRGLYLGVAGLFFALRR
jgi:hypothetical protein